MTKVEARKIALAILSLEDLAAIVAEQTDVIGLKRSEARKVVAAAHEVSQEMYSEAGMKAVERVVCPR